MDSPVPVYGAKAGVQRTVYIEPRDIGLIDAIYSGEVSTDQHLACINRISRVNRYGIYGSIRTHARKGGIHSAIVVQPHDARQEIVPEST